jgi:hypothetical protein
MVANSGPHLLAGGAIDLSGMMFLRWLKNEKLTFWEGIGAVLVGCFGACLPDLLEPPNNPSHRKFLHSMTVGGVGLNHIKALGRLPAQMRTEIL